MKDGCDSQLLQNVKAGLDMRAFGQPIVSVNGKYVTPLIFQKDTVCDRFAAVGART